MVSCASHDGLQIRTVSVPGAARIATTDPAALISAAPGCGGSVRGWSVPIASDGTFALTRQKREFFPSAWDPPTPAHPAARVAGYDSKLVGVAAKGRVVAVSNRRDVQISFQDVQQTGEVRWGSGVEHPQFRSVSLDASVSTDPSEWVVVHEAPSTTKDPNRYYLIVKTP
jgi:hypothetical protein